jgi:hypothetical protein
MNPKEHVRSFITSTEWLYFALKRWDERVNKLKISKDGDILIEGFPRSANTFGVVAVRHMQDREIKIGHHLHTIAHLKRAIRLHKPVLLLIREPEGTVSSMSMRFKLDDVEALLFRYIRFYEQSLDLAEHMVVAEFRDFTGDVATHIQRVNDRFKTSFQTKYMDETLLAEIHAEILNLNLHLQHDALEWSLPNDEKEAKKKEIIARLRDTFPVELERAKLLYANILDYT